jgi:hypothetical protein
VGRLKPPLNLDGLGLTYKSGDADTPGQLEQWIDGCDSWWMRRRNIH